MTDKELKLKTQMGFPNVSSEDNSVSECDNFEINCKTACGGCSSQKGQSKIDRIKKNFVDTKI